MLGFGGARAACVGWSRGKVGYAPRRGRGKVEGFGLNNVMIAVETITESLKNYKQKAILHKVALFFGFRRCEGWGGFECLRDLHHNNQGFQHHNNQGANGKLASHLRVYQMLL